MKFLKQHRSRIIAKNLNGELHIRYNKWEILGVGGGVEGGEGRKGRGGRAGEGREGTG
jgi:hypothetical protein